jgi:hypothetical protein
MYSSGEAVYGHHMSVCRTVLLVSDLTGMLSVKLFLKIKTCDILRYWLKRIVNLLEDVNLKWSVGPTEIWTVHTKVVGSKCVTLCASRPLFKISRKSVISQFSFGLVISNTVFHFGAGIDINFWQGRFQGMECRRAFSWPSSALRLTFCRYLLNFHKGKHLISDLHFTIYAW